MTAPASGKTRPPATEANRTFRWLVGRDDHGEDHRERHSDPRACKRVTDIRSAAGELRCRIHAQTHAERRNEVVDHEAPEDAIEAARCFERYVDEMFQHMWAEPKKLDDLEVLRAALESSRLPAAELLALTQDSSVKQALSQNTERSVARGSFGIPSFYVGDELFFGKDRLREVEEQIELQKQAASTS